MNKLIVFISLLLIGTFSSAKTPLKDIKKVNTIALEILLKNAGDISVRNNGMLSEFLAKTMVAGTYKMKNVCVLDKADSLYNCSLSFTDSETIDGETFESMQTLKYQIDIDKKGNPVTDRPLYGTIDLIIAG